MTDFETEGFRQQFVDDINALLQQRIDAAEPIELFSDRGDKRLELVQESDGSQFVKRSFSGDAVYHVERGGMSFPEAWDTMQSIFEEAGIPVVRTSLVSYVPDESAVMISEYHANHTPVLEAATQTKIDLVRKLPGLFSGKNGAYLSPECIQRDMFCVVKGADGAEEILVMDIDPLITRPHASRADAYLAMYVTRFSEFIWDTWCKPDERQKVVTAFMKAMTEVDDVVAKLEDIMSEPGKALMKTHMMCQGLDPREMGFNF